MGPEVSETEAKQGEKRSQMPVILGLSTIGAAIVLAILLAFFL